MVTDWKTHGVENVYLFMGVQIEGDEINLTSVDEDRGMPLFALHAKVSEINIEIIENAAQTNLESR